MTSALDRQQHIQRLFFLCALVLIGKAAQMQLFDDSFRRRAAAITVENLTVYPPRGLVFDRQGRLIINNEAMYDLMVTYNQVDFEHLDTMKLCGLLGISKDEFKEGFNKDWSTGIFSRSVPFVFAKKISSKTHARLQENLYQFPGFFEQVRNIRGYPDSVGAHVLGYINEVDPRDIEREKEVYEPGDYIGAAGLEAYYEKVLRGKKGQTNLLKDNLGRVVGKYRDGKEDLTAIAGSDLISSIDIDLQAYGEYLMQGKTGSVVAIEPESGDILAMISMPTYNPNLLTMTQDRGPTFSRLLNDPLKTFFDRTVMAKYPPGSIFKTVVSLIGLQEGTLRPNGSMTCAGGYTYAGHTYKCHHRGHVSNVVEALGHSCNTYYFQEFRNIIDKEGFWNPEPGMIVFSKYCNQLGLGRPLGIDYPNENGGNVPDTGYYNRLYPKRLGGWRSPTIMSLGIGQGELQLTTLQMANLAACIANRGYWIAPHLANRFTDGTSLPDQFLHKNVVEIDRQNFEYVVEGMAACVNYGTAHACAIPDIQVCGKTGTSQNPHGDDHSVFFAFAPKDKPKIAIAVYVENAGWGASYAAPIASLMIEKYLKGSIAENRIAMQERMAKANLTDKYLKMVAESQRPKTPGAATAPRDTSGLPKSEDFPSDAPDVPVGGQPTTARRERKK